MQSKKREGWRYYISWQLCLALLVSLIVHVVAFDGLDFLRLPAPEPTENIEARLVNLQPKPIAQTTKPVRKAAKPKPAAPEPEPAPSLPPAEPVVEPPAVAHPSPEPAVEPPDVEPEVVEAPVAERPPQTAAYIETDFELKRRINGNTESGTVGVAHVSYKVDDKGHYTIKSVAEAKGFVSLFVSGKLRQESEGRVTEKGLQPERFLYQYGNDEAKAQRANFDWATGMLEMQSAKGISTVPVDKGTQDLLSFMYQFMFTPPLEEMKLSITNGKRLRTYSYSFEGEEQITTRMGDFRTVHIAKSSADGKDRTEVWLAMDYQYIPVKIRKTEESGNVIEQIVTRLSTDILK